MKEENVWFFDEKGKLFPLRKEVYTKIVEASPNDLVIFLLDPDPKIRVVAKQRQLFLNKNSEIVCEPLNPSRKIPS